jgi:hypothetical protein
MRLLLLLLSLLPASRGCSVSFRREEPDTASPTPSLHFVSQPVIKSAAGFFLPDSAPLLPHDGPHVPPSPVATHLRPKKSKPTLAT